MKKIIKALCIAALGATMSVGFASCDLLPGGNNESVSSGASSQPSQEETYTVTFVDEKGIQIGDSYEVKKDETISAPDVSSYLSENHLSGYKIKDGDSWGELTSTIPANIASDMTILVVFESHVYSSTQSNDHAHWMVCNCGKTTEEQAHKFSEVTDKCVAADCVNEGKQVEACECGYERETKIDALGHELGAWQSDTDNHWKECSRVGCTALDLGKTAHTYDWMKKADDTAYEKLCTACSYVSETLNKVVFNTETLKNRFKANEGEQGAISLENDKISVDLSVEQGKADTTLWLDKKYSEFVMQYKLVYRSTDYTGERFASVMVGDYEIKYYPYSGCILLKGPNENGEIGQMAVAYEDSFAYRTEVEFEIKLMDGKLYIYVDGTPMVDAGNENAYIAENVTDAQVIGIVANRVKFDIENLVMYCGSGEDRVKMTTTEFDSETLKSGFTVSAGEENAVSFENDKISVNLSTAMPQEETAIRLNKKYQDFEIRFDFNYLSTSHTGERYATLKIGDFSIQYYPYNDCIVLEGPNENGEVGRLQVVYSGTLSQHTQVSFKVVAESGVLSVYIDNALVLSSTKINGAQEIGFYASRVIFDIENLVILHDEGMDR